MDTTHDGAITTRLPAQPLDQGLGRGVRTPGLLARWPVIGLLMVLLGGSAFVVLAVSLQTNGPLIQADLPVANALHAIALQSAPFLQQVMIFGFFLGEYGIVLIGAVVLVYFIHRRFWPEASMVVIAWAGEGAIWLVLSSYFDRPRPVFDVSVWRQMTVPSFPSGHSLSAVMCFSFLAYLLVPRMSTRFGEAAVIAAAVLIMFYIGFSRLFVGDHYLSDVLAGYALGVAWSGLAFTTIEWIFKKRIIGYVP